MRVILSSTQHITCWSDSNIGQFYFLEFYGQLVTNSFSGSIALFEIVQYSICYFQLQRDASDWRSALIGWATALKITDWPWPSRTRKSLEGVVLGRYNQCPAVLAVFHARWAEKAQWVTVTDWFTVLARPKGNSVSHWCVSTFVSLAGLELDLGRGMPLVSTCQCRSCLQITSSHLS
jgi:hypothetical protein